MEVTSLFELLKGAKELASIARVEPNQQNDRRQQQAVQDRISDLRSIYFAPRGVLSILKVIADGGYPTPEQIKSILPGFNDAEPSVSRARQRLDPEYDRNDRTLTLKAQRVLGEISYGKGGVRSKVQSLLNYSLTYGEPVSPEQAQQLIQEIGELNTAIEEAEEALVATLATNGNR